MITSCTRNDSSSDVERVIFLHHSTGLNVWMGGENRVVRKIKGDVVPRLVSQRCKETGSEVTIDELSFPSGTEYPWENFPFDYYNIWVLNGDDDYYMGEPTLKTLTKSYDVIVLKHCFPGSNIISDDYQPESLQTKTLGNYKYLYGELKKKFYEYPGTKFIVWTNAALVESATNEAEALRTREWVRWVKEEWDTPGDNIYLFDFNLLETGGELYLKPEYAMSADDSHPNKTISSIAAKSFVETLLAVTNNSETFIY